MDRDELVDYYVYKRAHNKYDFSQVKSELREKHNLSDSEISEIIDVIVDTELTAAKQGPLKSKAFLIFSLCVGLFAVIYCGYAIIYPMFHPEYVSPSTSMNYLCLAGGIYIV